MRSILRVFPNRFFAQLAIAGLIVGLVTSKVVLSVATITIMCNAFVNIHAVENFKKWLTDRTSQLFILLFLIYLFSGFYSEDTAYWVDRCRMKLPFLALPIGFVAVQKISRKQFRRWLLLYFITISSASLIVFLNYLTNFEEYNALLSKGQSIPAPLNDHIRFSIEIALAIIIGGYLLFDGIQKNWIKITIAVTTIFLVIFIHVFAVRTGMVGLYVTCIALVIFWVFSKKQYLLAIGTTVGAALFIYLLFLFTPSLQNRMSYFRYELDLIQKGELNPEHSDAQRLLSMHYGVQIGNSQPILGTGAGDIRNEMDALYKQNSGDVAIKSKLPHNQFVYVYAATGLIGLIIFLIAVFYPLLNKKRITNVLMLSFYCIVIFSFLTEHTLEIQVGTAFYLLFLLLIKKYIDDQNEVIPTNA